jgi:hypothetical protein
MIFYSIFWSVYVPIASDVGARRGTPQVPRWYVDNYVMLARVIRLEADVKHSLATPKTVDEALAELESKSG